jgi:chorismate synthase
LPGTQVHDAIMLESSQENKSSDNKSNKDPSLNLGYSLYRPTNRAGGIEGGISNGQPIVIRAAMKPIATTLNPQVTVDLFSGTSTSTRYERSDFCPVPRAVPVLEAMVALVLADVLIDKLGGDSMKEMLLRFDSLPKTRLEDLQMENHSNVWWE